MSTDQSRPEPSGPGEPTQPMDATQPIDIEPTDIEPTSEFAISDSPAIESPAPPVAARMATSEPAPVAAPTPTLEPTRSGLRVGTVVWGLVLAVIGAGVIAVAAGARFDLELASIGLLALAGVALLAGSITTSARRRHL